MKCYRGVQLPGWKGLPSDAGMFTRIHAGLREISAKTTMVATAIRAVVLRRSKHAVVLPKIDDLKELKMTLAERFETWTEEFEQRGIQKGIEKGIQQGIEKGIEKAAEGGVQADV